MAPRRAAALLLAALVPAATATTLDFSLLTTRDGVCNDGTHGGYYHKAGSKQSTTWLIFLESGGWCYDATSCGKRSPDQTSSKNYAPTLDLTGIFASTDPRLADAHLVYVPYCSSDAYVGDRDGPVWAVGGGADNSTNSVFQGGFHGAAILDGVFSALLDTHGLDSASDVLFAGFSAGGRGTMFNCDAMGRKLLAGSPSLHYACFFDSALWLDVEPYNSAAPSAAGRSQLAFELFNATGVVAANSPSCAAAYPGEGWKCIFGEYALPHVTTGQWFTNINLYDSYQLNTLNGIGSSPPWSGAKLEYTEAFRTRMESTLGREVPANNGSFGAYAAACYAHGDTLTDKWTGVRVQGYSLEDAVVAWFWGEGAVPRVLVDATKEANGAGCYL